jgi:hypothetical protein
MRRGVFMAAAVMLALGTLLSAPLGLAAQATDTRRSDAGSPMGPWHVGAGWSQSVQQNPFGTQWGDLTRGFNARVEGPAIRGARPVVEGARVDVVGACRSRELCDTLPGWTLRAGILLGDARGEDPRRSRDPLVTPYLQAELGVFLADDEEGAEFAPAGRLGLLLPAWNRIQPRLEMSRVRYPTTGGLWEVGLGVRVHLR